MTLPPPPFSRIFEQSPSFFYFFFRQKDFDISSPRSCGPRGRPPLNPPFGDGLRPPTAFVGPWFFLDGVFFLIFVFPPGSVPFRQRGILHQTKISLSCVVVLFPGLRVFFSLPDLRDLRLCGSRKQGAPPSTHTIDSFFLVPDGLWWGR